MSVAPAARPTRTDPPITRLICGLVLGLAGLVALVLPLGYFGLGYSALASALDTKARVKAEVINQVINASPELWKFEDARLGELLVRFRWNWTTSMPISWGWTAPWSPHRPRWRRPLP